MIVRADVRTVAAGYDELAPRWAAWKARVEGEPSPRFLDELERRLDPGVRLLDLGCGNGENARRLAKRFEVVGVDVSAEQLRRARAAAPTATFIQDDLATLDFPEASFDAVLALYSIMHVPRERHPELFASIRRWLRPGGVLLASLSHVGGPDRTEPWLGVEMFFSGFDAETNSRLIREAGFDVFHEELVWMQEPERETAFLWILARRPASLGG